MPAFCRSFREGDCVHVDEGGGSSLDLVVKSIGGSRELRNAVIEIVDNGISTGYKTLEQNRDHDEEIIDGVYACIPNSLRKSKKGRVIISYWFLDDYRVSIVPRKRNELVHNSNYP